MTSSILTRSSLKTPSTDHTRSDTSDLANAELFATLEEAPIARTAFRISMSMNRRLGDVEDDSIQYKAARFWRTDSMSTHGYMVRTSAAKTSTRAQALDSSSDVMMHLPACMRSAVESLSCSFVFCGSSIISPSPPGAMPFCAREDCASLMIFSKLDGELRLVVERVRRRMNSRGCLVCAGKIDWEDVERGPLLLGGTTEESCVKPSCTTCTNRSSAARL